jgi:salicylate biosynthesis isochorismate synthase/menaquinone-specific isochorismate synthase
LPLRSRDDPFTLAPPERWAFGARATQAVRRARAGAGEALASLTIPLRAPVDPSAVVAAARRPGEPWFCFEQPDREGAALAALGSVRELQAGGEDRFARVAGAWRRLAAGAAADPPDGPPGAGLVAVGGFAFAPDGGTSPHWLAYPPAALTVPEVSLARRDGRTWLTLTALAAPDDTEDDLVDRVQTRLAELSVVHELPLLDPAPAGRVHVASALSPEHYEHAVAQAVERIRGGELEKVVLAREVRVHAPAPHDPAAVLGVLREAFRSCYVYCVGRGGNAFLGASPELLVRREGQRASTVALAGSTRRSADPAVDDHLGERLMQSDKDRREQAIVTRRIERALRPHALWVTAASEPRLVRVANIQHLATPIRAQLARPLGAVDLAAILHPTPAVGGEPFAAAAPLIPKLEGLDRGWYAGPIGWTDAAEDGEFCVGLRCALLEGAIAHCFAGDGIVEDSEPSAELAETEIKLEALLPVLSA